MNAFERDEILTAIARAHLPVQTLVTRFDDRLDFHDIAVWDLRAALAAAFRAGQRN